MVKYFFYGFARKEDNYFLWLIEIVEDRVSIFFRTNCRTKAVVFSNVKWSTGGGVSIFFGDTAANIGVLISVKKCIRKEQYVFQKSIVLEHVLVFCLDKRIDKR
jgi:hypothetical protein